LLPPPKLAREVCVSQWASCKVPPQCKQHQSKRRVTELQSLAPERSGRTGTGCRIGARRAVLYRALRRPCQHALR
jgi:hypothetical protein